MLRQKSSLISVGYLVLVLILVTNRHHADAFSTSVTRIVSARKPQSILSRVVIHQPELSIKKQSNDGLSPSFSFASPIVGTTRKAVLWGSIEWADLLYDDTSMAIDAWQWTSGMGAPAALVAAAVLVTLAETREDTTPRKSDSNTTRFLKRLMRFLLLTSFALEVVSIFVGNMTGNILLGHGPQLVAKKIVGYKAPLALLYHHHEFEFLTTQITFLQGLLNWLGAEIVDLILPKPTETTSAKRMNKALAAWLVSFAFWMLAFYNNHINFYADYAAMLKRFGVLFWGRYVMTSPLRPMLFLYGPAFLIATFLTWRAFTSPAEEDDDEEDAVSARTI